jgi:hypothetical protein
VSPQGIAWREARCFSSVGTSLLTGDAIDRLTRALNAKGLQSDAYVTGITDSSDSGSSILHFATIFVAHG